MTRRSLRSLLQRCAREFREVAARREIPERIQRRLKERAKELDCAAVKGIRT